MVERERDSVDGERKSNLVVRRQASAITIKLDRKMTIDSGGNETIKSVESKKEVVEIQNDEAKDGTTKEVRKSLLKLKNLSEYEAMNKSVKFKEDEKNQLNNEESDANRMNRLKVKRDAGYAMEGSIVDKMNTTKGQMRGSADEIKAIKNKSITVGSSDKHRPPSSFDINKAERGAPKYGILSENKRSITGGNTEKRKKTVSIHEGVDRFKGIGDYTETSETEGQNDKKTCEMSKQENRMYDKLGTSTLQKTNFTKEEITVNKETEGEVINKIIERGLIKYKYDVESDKVKLLISSNDGGGDVELICDQVELIEERPLGVAGGGSPVKEWLGGFRNRESGVAYHNAKTETPHWWRARRRAIATLVTTTEAQTVAPRMHQKTQIPTNKSTQVSVKGFYIDPRNDRYLSSKRFKSETEATVWERRNSNASKIQKWYRKRIKAKLVKRAINNVVDEVKDEKAKTKAEQQKWLLSRLKTYMMMTFPTKRNDIYILRGLLNEWKTDQVKEIKLLQGGAAERISQACSMVEKEMKLVYAFEAQLTKCRTELARRRDLKLLEETSRSIIQNKGDTTTIVDTLPVQRAREIKEIFVLYRKTSIKRAERIENLLRIKDAMEGLSGAENLKELIDCMVEEMDMLSIKLPDCYLEGVRKRGEEMFLWLIKQKEFNPGAENYRPWNYPRVKQRSMRCPGCHKVKNPSSFPISVFQRCFNVCTSCTATRMIPINMTPYSLILQLLRLNEAKKCPKNIFCNLIQPLGIFYLVNNLWHGRSAISEDDYIYDLRLIRWDQGQEWSPWNCILMTQEEALCHERIQNNQTVYHNDFIQRVKLIHLTAKFKFKYILWTQNYTLKTGIYNSTVQEKNYINPFRKRQALQFSDPIFNQPPIKGAHNIDSESGKKKGNIKC